MSAPHGAQEIREALEAHARFDDTAALARLGAVRHRVRVVRRRRRAALAGVAAAVVATVGGLATVLPGDHEAAPASRTFGDVVAPATMTAAGATYSFDRMVTGTGKVSLAAAGTPPALVTWATAGATTATIKQQPSDRYRSAADFTDFQRIYAPEGTTVTATGDGRIALALYTLSAPAAGIAASVDETPVVLRDQLPGFEKISSFWAGAGQTDATINFTLPEGTLEASTFCTGAPGYDFHVDVEGPGSSGACDDEPSVDGPGDRTGFTEGVRTADGVKVQPGDNVTAHLWLSRKGSDEPVRGPIEGVQMGAAFYETEPAVATIGAFPLTRQREEAGHTWRFVRVLSGGEVGRTLSTQIEARDRPVLLLFTAGRRAGLVRAEVDGVAGVGMENSTDGTGLSSYGPLGAGEHRVEVTAQHPTTFGVALYELAD